MIYKAQGVVKQMNTRFGRKLRRELSKRDIIPFIGVYDVFSASIAAKYYDALFISGFGFAASYYGLPDIGLIAWSDMVAFVQRVRTILPNHHLLVDIDDGYGDGDVACHVVSLLEAVGASGVIIEDQERPKRCGHLDGKQLMELEKVVEKLSKVLATRQELFVVARTDAIEVAEIVRRVKAFAAAGADAILVEAIRDLDIIRTLRRHIDQPLMFNQIAGGKSPRCNLSELRDAGISLVNYSTCCLFPARRRLVPSLSMALRS